MKKLWSFLFLDHPHSIGEGYLEHGWHATMIGCYLLVFAVVPVFIHAVIPGFFTTTTSRHIHDLEIYLQKRAPQGKKLS